VLVESISILFSFSLLDTMSEDRQPGEDTKAVALRMLQSDVDQELQVDTRLLNEGVVGRVADSVSRLTQALQGWLDVPTGAPHPPHSPPGPSSVSLVFSHTFMDEHRAGACWIVVHGFLFLFFRFLLLSLCLPHRHPELRVNGELPSYNQLVLSLEDHLTRQHRINHVGAFPNIQTLSQPPHPTPTPYSFSPPESGQPQAELPQLYGGYGELRQEQVTPGAFPLSLKRQRWLVLMCWSSPETETNGGRKSEDPGAEAANEAPV